MAKLLSGAPVSQALSRRISAGCLHIWAACVEAGCWLCFFILPNFSFMLMTISLPYAKFTNVGLAICQNTDHSKGRNKSNGYSG